MDRDLIGGSEYAIPSSEYIYAAPPAAAAPPPIAAPAPQPPAPQVKAETMAPFGAASAMGGFQITITPEVEKMLLWFILIIIIVLLVRIERRTRRLSFISYTAE